MTLSESVSEAFPRPPQRDDAPEISEALWGYSISHPAAHRAGKTFASMFGRFFGAILIMAAAGLWIMPDSLLDADVFSMKLAAMVVFSVLGGYLVWAGRAAMHPEFQIDLKQREVRVGHQSPRRGFTVKSRISFDDIGSVYLLRSKERGQFTRLFLRIGNTDMALEVVRGAREPLERLRDRLAFDLTHDAAEADLAS